MSAINYLTFDLVTHTLILGQLHVSTLLISSPSLQIKLADFGFARHFKDEGMKPIDMTSLAGTPVFMVSQLDPFHSNN